MIHRVRKEVFSFKDSSTAEAVASKGSSTSPLLYELVVRLFKLSTTFSCSIHVIHVSGTGMIKQGTDGLSRGDMLEGVLKGRDVLSYVPVHLSALERDAFLKEWILEWTTQKGYKTAEFLKPCNWFKKDHGIRGYRENIDGRVIPSYSKGALIWTPPPAATRYALEELRQARHNRQNSLHIFIVPKFMTPEWYSQLYKAVALIFSLPAGHANWASTNHKPLTIAICFRYIHRAPWELKGTPLMGRMARELCGLFKKDPSSGQYVVTITQGHEQARPFVDSAVAQSAIGTVVP